MNDHDDDVFEYVIEDYNLMKIVSNNIDIRMVFHHYELTNDFSNWFVSKNHEYK